MQGGGNKKRKEGMKQFFFRVWFHDFFLNGEIYAYSCSPSSSSSNSPSSSAVAS